MATKFLDDNGLLYFWQKIKAFFAPLASPAFTGTPTAPTATSGDNSTQVATTAFVQAAVTSGSGEANQNAFSNVKVGNSTIAADTTTDTLTLVAGSNVSLTPNTSSDSVTIAATDTTYSDATSSTHGLMSTADKTKLDGLDQLVESATGESVIIGDGSGFESVVVYGQSVQDGTPTPSEPIEVQVVQGVNLLPSNATTKTVSGITFTVNADGSVTANGTATAGITFDFHSLVSNGFLTIPAGTYTLSGCPSGGSGSTYKVDIQTMNNTYGTDYGDGFTFTISDSRTYKRARIVIYSGVTVNNLTFRPQLVSGSTATPYVPYGSIGLVVGNTITSIPLQGNVLASLPDGMHDRLLVDSTGHVTLEKNVGKYVITGQENGSTSQEGDYYRFYSSAIEDMQAPLQVSQGTVNGYCTHSRYAVSYAGQYTHAYVVYTKRFLLFSTNATPLSEYVGAELYYPLATLQTIDLGYIDMLDIPNGSQISIIASIVPNIEASWWTKYAEPIARAITSIKNLAV